MNTPQELQFWDTLTKTMVNQWSWCFAWSVKKEVTKEICNFVFWPLLTYMISVDSYVFQIFQTFTYLFYCDTYWFDNLFWFCQMVNRRDTDHKLTGFSAKCAAQKCCSIFLMISHEPRWERSNTAQVHGTVRMRERWSQRWLRVPLWMKGPGLSEGRTKVK